MTTASTRPEVSTANVAMARRSWIYRGSKLWHVGVEASANLGDLSASPCRSRACQLTEGGPMGGQESDPLIVLRDGRAVHVGKRRAGWIIEQRTHVSELNARSSRVTLPALSCCCASVQRSLMRENRT